MLFGCVVLVGLGAYTYATKESPASAPKTNTQPTVSIDVSRTDTDRDGVPDWKENLFGFNPMLSDSDGDGTPDSTEILEQEKNLQIKQEGQGVERGQNETLTETATLARDGMKAVIALKQQGALSSDSVTALTETAVDSIQNKTYTTSYSSKDIKIIKSNADTLAEYANKVAYIFIKEEQGFLQDGPALLKTYTLTRSPSDLQKIKAIRQSVNNMGITLLSFQTPDELSPAALQMIQQFDIYGQIVDDLLKLDSDPVASLSALSQFYQVRYTLTNSAVEVVREAQKLGITFTSSDPGGILLQAAKK